MDLEDFAFQQARIGDVLRIQDGREVPEGWVVVEGQEMISGEHLEFARAMSLTLPTFRLPEPSEAEGFRFIIKLASPSVTD